jgi:hypothetical protein
MPEEFPDGVEEFANYHKYVRTHLRMIHIMHIMSAATGPMTYPDRKPPYPIGVGLNKMDIQPPPIN